MVPRRRWISLPHSSIWRFNRRQWRPWGGWSRGGLGFICREEEGWARAHRMDRAGSVRKSRASVPSLRPRWKGKLSPWVHPSVAQGFLGVHVTDWHVGPTRLWPACNRAAHGEIIARILASTVAGKGIKMASGPHLAEATKQQTHGMRGCFSGARPPAAARASRAVGF